MRLKPFASATVMVLGMASISSSFVQADEPCASSKTVAAGYASIIVLKREDPPAINWNDSAGLRIVGLRLAEPRRRVTFYPKLLLTYEGPKLPAKTVSITPATLAKLGLSLMDFRTLVADPEQTLAAWVEDGWPQPAITYVVPKVTCAFELTRVPFKSKG